jgi:hypothetical protein
MSSPYYWAFDFKCLGLKHILLYLMLSKIFNNFSGALAIKSISSLIMKLPNGSNDGHLKYLVIITNNHISNVEYNYFDIIDVITIIM